MRPIPHTSNPATISLHNTLHTYTTHTHYTSTRIERLQETPPRGKPCLPGFGHAGPCHLESHLKLLPVPPRCGLPGDGRLHGSLFLLSCPPPPHPHPELSDSLLGAISSLLLPPALVWLLSSMERACRPGTHLKTFHTPGPSTELSVGRVSTQ